MSEDTGSAEKAKQEETPSAAEIAADLEAKRAHLADTVDGLTAQLDPRENLQAVKAQLSDTVANASDEAQAFISRLQRGQQRALEQVGFTVAAVTAVVGLLLIRRGR